MSWGAFLMYYRCPKCGKKFCWDLNTVQNPKYGHCPKCDLEGELVGESGKLPNNPEEYEDVSE